MQTEFPQTIEISVTAEDIAEGWKGECFQCAISVAARRVFPGKIISTGAYLIVADSDVWKGTRYFMPEAAQIFIYNFDKGNPVEPFSFTAEKL